MEYIRAYEKENALGKQVVCAVVLPAVLIGGIGWGKYFAKKIESADIGRYFKKNACYASEQRAKPSP